MWVYADVGGFNPSNQGFMDGGDGYTTVYAIHFEKAEQHHQMHAYGVCWVTGGLCEVRGSLWGELGLHVMI